DHRKDDDCCGLVGLAAEAHDAPIVREFDNGAHPAVSSAVQKLSQAGSTDPESAIFPPEISHLGCFLVSTCLTQSQCWGAGQGAGHLARNQRDQGAAKLFKGELSMAREIDRLNPLRVKNEQTKGRYADGNGLYLEIDGTGGKSWI